MEGDRPHIQPDEYQQLRGEAAEAWREKMDAKKEAADQAAEREAQIQQARGEAAEIRAQNRSERQNKA